MNEFPVVFEPEFMTIYLLVIISIFFYNTGFIA